MTIQIEYETERKLEIPYEKLAEKWHPTSWSWRNARMRSA